LLVNISALPGEKNKSEYTGPYDYEQLSIMLKVLVIFFPVSTLASFLSKRKPLLFERNLLQMIIERLVC
jgi:hypothetical protein